MITFVLNTKGWKIDTSKIWNLNAFCNNYFYIYSGIFFLQQHVYILLKVFDDNSLYLMIKTELIKFTDIEIHWESSFGILPPWKFVDFSLITLNLSF